MISEFPLFVFTTMAGLSAGAYVASAIFPLGKERKKPWLFPLVCLVLLAIGLVGCLGHLGRPAMFLNALANPRAGIAQEAYASIAFGILIVIDLIVAWRKGSNSRALAALCAVVGVVLAIVMGMSYLANVGTPAWANWATVPTFVVGDLAMGFALYALFEVGAYKKDAFTWASAVLSVLFAIVCAIEAIHFAGVGEDGMLFWVAAVVMVVAAVLAFLAKKRDESWFPAVVFACAVVGVIVARWAFYMGSII